jgi:hypothetical protein
MHVSMSWPFLKVFQISISGSDTEKFVANLVRSQTPKCGTFGDTNLE